MSSPFLAEIRMWGCTFAPYGWAFCDGQIVPISQFTALFSLLGTNFGGDGRSSFGLPNLQGAAPMNAGKSSQSGSTYDLGQSGGEQMVTLSQQQVPSHTHALQGEPRPADLNTPGPQNSLARSTPATVYTEPQGAAAPQAMSPGVIPAASGGRAHNNLMPYQTLNFCIALQGIFPPRS
ncbi:MAG: phage tail protein [Streptosporangiaceae bacterium]